MAINWRQRAPILRVLAAVYAELGEDAFKGRYGRIAKLYGNEATYDAIKSFFAKDIVRMAEDLKARVADQREEFNEIPHGQRSGVMQAPIRLTFDDNDDEIIVTGEREVGVEVRNDQPARNGRQGMARYESFDDGCNLNSPARDYIHALNSGHLPSATPGPSFSAETQKQASEVSIGKQAQRRKRPYSNIEEPDNIPLSFGYVTNRGKHRCALCTTELPSADILRKHESLSELHLANLKDPVVVSRGYATLAECKNLSDNVSRQQNCPNPALSNTGGFSRRDDAVAGQQSERIEQSSTPHHRLGSTLTGNENDTVLDTIHLAEPRRGPVQRSPQYFNRNADNREGENGPTPDDEIVEYSAKGKRNGPAQTVPGNQSATPGTQSHPHIENGASTQQQGCSTAVPKRSRDDTRVEDVPPTWIAQILLSSGMELLAKKYIEEHPELKAGFYKFIQDMQASHGVGVAEMRYGAREDAAEGLDNFEK